MTAEFVLVSNILNVSLLYCDFETFLILLYNQPTLACAVGFNYNMKRRREICQKLKKGLV